MNDLVPKIITPKEVFVPNGLNAILSGVKTFLDEEKAKPFDINNEKNREARKSFAYQISRSKTFVDDKGKTYVAELKAKPKIVDAERKRFRDLMDLYRDEARDPVTKWEFEEEAREQKRREDEILKLDWIEALQIDDLFNREREVKRKEEKFTRIAEEARLKEEAERLAKEQAERDERLKKEAIAQAEKAAQEKIEIERLRALKAETDAREAAEQAELEKAAAAERSKKELMDAEKARLEAIKQADIDKQAAIELATRQAEERARLEKVAADKKAAEEKAIADKKAADTRHQAHVNNKIVSAFCELGWKKDEAKAIVTTVATGKIPFMAINY